MLDDFKEDLGWHTVNDNVMGGRSQGLVHIDDGILQFEGALNTNGGGFASIRRSIEPGTFSHAAGLVLRVKSDGRGYRLTLRGEQQFRGRAVSYQANFPTLPKGQWRDIRIEFDALKPSLFGQPVAVAPLSLASVGSIGIIIADGIDGPFKLQVDSLALASD